jgi:hypothetical protein
MDTRKLIEKLGGPAAVIAITGLTKGRISQWIKADSIPTPWLLVFRFTHPRIGWDQYTGSRTRRRLSKR